MSIANSSQPLAPPALSATVNLEVSTPLASKPSEFANLDLSRLDVSKTNPRKHFDGPEMDELVASVKAHGVLVPILVRDGGWRRPFLGELAGPEREGEVIYEIVAGERRYRAAIEAKLKQIPARIVSLTNEQALEVQIVENLQRKDVTPLEEATGYAQLFASMQKERPKDPRQGLVDEIAKKIGKSSRYVYARMKLVELAEPVKKALAGGAIAASHADELVRLQPADQEKALEFLTLEQQYGSQKRKRTQPPSIREFKEFLKDETYVDLSKAPFKLDDAKLVVEAGACTTCPKLASNNPLFDKKEASDKTCTDPACYQQKRVALVQIQLGDFKAKGVQPILISRDYAHDKKDREPGVLYQGDYVDHGYAGGKYAPVKEGQCNDTKLALVIASKTREFSDEKKDEGRTFWVCVNKRDCKVHGYSAASSSGSMSANAADERRKQRIQKEFRARVFQQLAAKLKKPKREDLELIAFEFFQKLGHYMETPLISVLEWDPKIGQWDGKSALKKFIASWTDEGLLGNLLLFSIAGDLNVPMGRSERADDLLAVAARHGIDHAAILEQVKEEKKPKAKKAKKAVQTPAKPKSGDALGKLATRPRRRPEKQAAVRKPEPAKKGASPKKAQATGKKGGRK